MYSSTVGKNNAFFFFFLIRPDNLLLLRSILIVCINYHTSSLSRASHHFAGTR